MNTNGDNQKVDKGTSIFPEVFDVSEPANPDRMPSGQAAEIARLSEEVEQLKDKIGEILFVSVFVVVLVIDIFVFQSFEIWPAPVVLGLLQVAFLFVFARICRVNDVMRLIELFFDAIDKYKGNGGSKSSST